LKPYEVVPQVQEVSKAEDAPLDTPIDLLPTPLDSKNDVPNIEAVKLPQVEA
jgi:hypothetical protein